MPCLQWINKYARASQVADAAVEAYQLTRHGCVRAHIGSTGTLMLVQVFMLLQRLTS